MSVSLLLMTSNEDFEDSRVDNVVELVDFDVDVYGVDALVVIVPFPHWTCTIPPGAPTIMIIIWT